MHLKSMNQKGLLAYIIDLFDSMDIDIVTAKVHTIKNRVRDMFLIEKNGNFCHNVDIIVDKLTTDKEKRRIDVWNCRVYRAKREKRDIVRWVARTWSTEGTTLQVLPSLKVKN